VSGAKSPFTDTMALNGVGTVCALLGVIAMRYVDRRSLYLFGVGAAAICLFIVAAIGTATSTTNETAGRASVAFVMLYLCSYNFGIASVSWTIAGEIPSNHLRSQTVTVAMATNSAVSCLISGTFPYYINPAAHPGTYLGPKLGFIFGPACVIIFLWIYFFVPETRGRTLEELDELFLNDVNARKFKTYECVGLTHTEVVSRTRFGEEDKPAVHVTEQA